MTRRIIRYWGNSIARSFRESEEDYPLSQEYLGEIEFKVLDLETAGDSTVEG
jgi:hypothetical protein